eukprot:3824332-Rhodomonas_salina.1
MPARPPHSAQQLCPMPTALSATTVPDATHGICGIHGARGISGHYGVDGGSTAHRYLWHTGFVLSDAVAFTFATAPSSSALSFPRAMGVLRNGCALPLFNASVAQVSHHHARDASDMMPRTRSRYHRHDAGAATDMMRQT